MNGLRFYPIFMVGSLLPASESYFWINLFKSTPITLISRKRGVTSYISSLCLPRSIFPPKFPINILTPNVNYSSCTTPLTSKVAFYIFIQQI